MNCPKSRGAAPCRIIRCKSNRVDYSWQAGLVVSGVVYWAFSRSLDLTREQAAIEASDRELEELARQ